MESRAIDLFGKGMGQWVFQVWVRIATVRMTKRRDAGENRISLDQSA